MNLEMVVAWLRAADVPITLVPAGQSAAGNLVAEEDLICAEAVRGLLQGKAVDGERLLGKTEAVIRSSYDRNAIADLVYVLDRDRHPVVPICFMDQEGFIRVAAASR